MVSPLGQGGSGPTGEGGLRLWVPHAEVFENLVTGGILQVIGFVIQIMALLSSNRSIGLLPAYRGVQSGGPYSWVRHPLYTAHVITLLGYLINNQSFYNAAVVLAGTVFLVMRIYCEEKLLLKYADYTRYANRIRWRLIPAIW
jgi:protein-S-isoprenylcysteine O-methyltransferase Ste14